MMLRRLINIMIAGTCLVAFTSCRDFEPDMKVLAGQTDPDDRYLNFTFVVNSGHYSATRADEQPKGEENGDGREAGFMRENYVSGVTLVFYRNSDGINATASSTPALADTKVDLVKYYPVTIVSRDAQGTPYTTKQDEAIYTTGEQKITDTDFDLSATYRVLVIANADLTTGSDKIEKGNSLADVRDKVYTAALYTGTGLGDKAYAFVMTSENDIELNFAGAGVKTIDKVGSYTKELYSFSGIRIERMAARIDFSTQYNYKVGPDNKYAAEYKTQDKSSKNYAYPGYVYPVYKTTDSDGNPTSADRFVVTAIVPFNLSLTNTGCSEYLFKRTNDTSSPYLAVETTTNWVIDPHRASKTVTDHHPTYFDYKLTDIETTLLSTDPHGDLAAKGNYLSTASFQTSSARYDLTVSDPNTADNLIIAYPKENTLLPDTKLYYYATGLAIEGYYYVNDDATATPTRFVYVGYLRHQGEAESYTIVEPNALDKTATCKPGLAMNFGVVRNNIYRVSIHKINEKGSMELSIKVKKWDPYIHEYIYM